MGRWGTGMQPYVILTSGHYHKHAIPLDLP